jgi:hypothetical protein
VAASEDLPATRRGSPRGMGGGEGGAEASSHPDTRRGSPRGAYSGAVLPLRLPDADGRCPVRPPPAAPVVTRRAEPTPAPAPAAAASAPAWMHPSWKPVTCTPAAYHPCTPAGAVTCTPSPDESPVATAAGNWNLAVASWQGATTATPAATAAVTAVTTTANAAVTVTATTAAAADTAAAAAAAAATTIFAASAAAVPPVDETAEIEITEMDEIARFLSGEAGRCDAQWTTAIEAGGGASADFLAGTAAGGGALPHGCRPGGGALPHGCRPGGGGLQAHHACGELGQIAMGEAGEFGEVLSEVEIRAHSLGAGQGWTDDPRGVPQGRRPRASSIHAGLGSSGGGSQREHSISSLAGLLRGLTDGELAAGVVHNLVGLAAEEEPRGQHDTVTSYDGPWAQPAELAAADAVLAGGAEAAGAEAGAAGPGAASPPLLRRVWEVRRLEKH